MNSQATDDETFDDSGMPSQSQKDQLVGLQDKGMETKRFPISAGIRAHAFV